MDLVRVSEILLVLAVASMVFAGAEFKCRRKGIDEDESHFRGVGVRYGRVVLLSVSCIVFGLAGLVVSVLVLYMHYYGGTTMATTPRDYQNMWMSPFVAILVVLCGLLSAFLSLSAKRVEGQMTEYERQAKSEIARIEAKYGSQTASPGRVDSSARNAPSDGSEPRDTRP